MAGKVTEDLDQMAEINVTPLVDVMLVLLIIFIITAPMLVQGLNVNLPKQDAPALDPESSEPLILTITSDRVILLGDDPVHLQLLPDRLGALLAGDDVEERGLARTGRRDEVQRKDLAAAEERPVLGGISVVLRQDTGLDLDQTDVARAWGVVDDLRRVFGIVPPG